MKELELIAYCFGDDDCGVLQTESGVRRTSRTDGRA